MAELGKELKKYIKRNVESIHEIGRASCRERV